MTLLHHFIVLGYMVATLSGQSLGQVSSSASRPPSEETIESQLFSGDPRLVAWGAHAALVARDHNLVPDLLSLAGKWQPPQDRDATETPAELTQQQKDERDATAAVLDALIQLHAQVPSETLRSLAPHFAPEVAILMSRLPASDAQALSLELYHSRADALQYVSAALLALQPPPGFAADLLGHVTVSAVVFVANPDQGGFGRGGSGGSCFAPTEESHKGWPKIGQYFLSKQKKDGAILVVAGIDPVYARREELTHYSGDQCHKAFGVYLGPGERLRLISEMLGASRDESTPWNTAPITTITFQSPEQFERALLSFAAQGQRKYRVTIAALAARGLMTSSEAEAPETLPKLELMINDMRGPDAVALPELTNLPSRVELRGPYF